MLIKVIYLNGRRGRSHTEVALQAGADNGVDVVITEAIEDQQRRPIHESYDLTWNRKYMSA